MFVGERLYSEQQCGNLEGTDLEQCAGRVSFKQWSALREVTIGFTMGTQNI
jgi:hypothetical protein